MILAAYLKPFGKIQEPFYSSPTEARRAQVLSARGPASADDESFVRSLLEKASRRRDLDGHPFTASLHVMLGVLLSKPAGTRGA